MHNFEEYYFNKKVDEVAVDLIMGGFDHKFLVEWFEYNRPELLTEDFGSGPKKPLSQIVGPRKPESLLGIEPKHQPVVEAVDRNIDQIINFFDRLKGVVDKEYESELDRGHEEGWGEGFGGGFAFRQFVQKYIRPLAEYFGETDPKMIMRKAANVARRKAPLKKGDDPKYQRLLQGLVSAYEASKSEKQTRKGFKGDIDAVVNHYNGLKDAIEALKQDVRHFQGLYSVHKMGRRHLNKKDFGPLSIKYTKGEAQPRHEPIDPWGEKEFPSWSSAHPDALSPEELAKRIKQRRLRGATGLYK